MSVFEKLNNLNLPDETKVTLALSEGVDVFVHNETEVETAISETTVVNDVAELITTPGLDLATRWGDSPVQSLRDLDLLDDYERGSEGFSEFVSETIGENFYDQEFIEYSTEKYDHKRGFCTLSAEFEVQLKNLLASRPILYGWEVSVPTENGTLTLS
tara:strand:- start:48 stop:521 length:474 start_codon:yes stop_codon:yes gene_type:complete